MKKTLLIIPFLLFLSACGSRSILPEKSSVEVSREKANKKCKNLGTITGTSLSVKATQEVVLEDLKQEAANKGANYVQVKQFSDSGTSVTGIAFECP